jgi:mannosylfructose-phosphate synthase
MIHLVPFLSEIPYPPSSRGCAHEGGRGRIAMIATSGQITTRAAAACDDDAAAAEQMAYVLQLSQVLASLGYVVDIWTRRCGAEPELEAAGPGVRIFRARCGGDGFIAREQLYRSIGEWVTNALVMIHQHALEYDLVSSHYWDAGIAGRGFALSLELPHVHTPHSLGLWKRRHLAAHQRATVRHDAGQERDDLGTRIDCERQLYRAADLVIGTTPAQIEVLHDEYGVPQEKLHMVPPGFDAQRFAPVPALERHSLRERLGFHGKVVLSLARPDCEAGCDLLIQSFARVIQQVPDARLHLACGHGTCRDEEARRMDECRQLARQLGLLEKVHFAGRVADAERPDYFRAADLFVLPSRYEPFGIAAVEAMACGTPVVTTTRGGLWQTLSFGIDGLFADSLDPDSLGTIIAAPLIDPILWERLARLGAATARNTFKWSSSAQHFLWALDELERARADAA